MQQLFLHATSGTEGSGVCGAGLVVLRQVRRKRTPESKQTPNRAPCTAQDGARNPTDMGRRLGKQASKQAHQHQNKQSPMMSQPTLSCGAVTLRFVSSQSFRVRSVTAASRSARRPAEQWISVTCFTCGCVSCPSPILERNTSLSSSLQSVRNTCDRLGGV